MLPKFVCPRCQRPIPQFSRCNTHRLQAISVYKLPPDVFGRLLAERYGRSIKAIVRKSTKEKSL